MSGPIPLSTRMLLTPPYTPKKKRRVLGETEDSSEDWTIEQYLYRKDPFRCTSLAAPLPLPIRRTSLPSDGMEETLEKLRPHIQAETDLFIKDPYTLSFVHVLRPDYPTGNVKRLTLSVEIYKGHEQPNAWAQARDNLHTLLRNAGFESIDVDIVDESRAFMPCVFPQSVNAGSIGAYESVRDTISGLLLKQLGSSWNCMSLFRVGKSLEAAVPSIVVFVEPLTSTDWQRLEATIRQIVAPTTPPGEALGIEFLPGKYSHLTGKDLDGKELLERGKSALRMGSSIGMQGDDSSGTLGGFATLKVGNHIHEGFITNHHVVRPKLDTEGAADLSRKGFRYNSDKHVKPMIQWPSPEDLAATREAMLREMKTCSGEAEKYQEMQKTRLMLDKDAQPRLEEYRQRFVKIVDDIQRQLTDIDHKFPVDLGRTLISSGDLVTSDRAILDWAFVEASPSLRQFLGSSFPVPNELPYRNDPQLRAKRYRGAAPYIAFETGDPPLIADEFGSIVKGAWYFKKGRTSGITSGLCNGTEAEINNRTGLRYTETGDVYTLGPRTTRELMIMSYVTIRDGIADKDFQDEFSEPGDSGSFVVDALGRVCGLLYGEHTGLCGPPAPLKRSDCGAGLVTSMTDVLASIAKKTTFEVVQGDGMIQVELSLPSRK